MYVVNVRVKCVSDQVVYTARAYLGINSVKQQGVFLLPSGCNATVVQYIEEQFYLEEVWEWYANKPLYTDSVHLFISM